MIDACASGVCVCVVAPYAVHAITGGLVSDLISDLKRKVVLSLLQPARQSCTEPSSSPTLLALTSGRPGGGVVTQRRRSPPYLLILNSYFKRYRLYPHFHPHV